MTNRKTQIKLCLYILQYQKRRRSSFTEEIDTVSVIEENGEILYECDTDGEIVLKLNDGVLTVTVPTINDSCFEN